MARYTPTERIGVSAIESIVASEFGWIFREQMIADMGIDAHLELVEDGSPTGKLIGVQIKTGLGNFTNKDDSLIYYGTKEHREYWLNHSLPVVIVAHLPETQETFWALVNEETIEDTPKHWKIVIPKKQVFGKVTGYKLSKLFEGSEAQQKLRRLTLQEPLMRHIVNGGKVSVHLEDWINKSLGRSQVIVYVDDFNGGESIQQEYFVFHTRFDVESLAKALFPWCKVEIDHDFYEENFEEVDDGTRGWWDEDDYRYVPAPAADEIYPYANSANEVDLYRVMLKLNKLGKAFITLSDYLAKPGHNDLFDT